MLPAPLQLEGTEESVAAMLGSFVLNAGLFAALTAPGVLFHRGLFPEEERHEGWIQGTVWGLAVCVLLVFYAIRVHLHLFFPLWCAWCLGAAIVYWKGHNRQAAAELTPPRVVRLLGVLIAVVALTRFVPALLHSVPPGFDPTMHLILAHKALALKTFFTTWEPFDPAVTNYPLGMHFLLALFSSVTQTRPHEVYNFLMPLLGTLTTAQVYVLARRTLRDPVRALWAAFAFGLLAVYGSIDYYRWGGLPNLMAMGFLLLSLTLLLEHPFTWPRVVLFGLAFVAIFATHHHVMITAAVVYAAVFTGLLLRREGRPSALRLIAAGVVALVAGGVFIVPYALRVVRLRETTVHRFHEAFFTPVLLAESLGVVFLCCVIAGLVLTARQLRRQKEPAGRPWRVVVPALVMLMILFAVFSYGYRLYTFHRYGEAFVAFTPSRFLSDAVPFLAIFAAAPLVWFWGLRQFSTGAKTVVLAVMVLTTAGDWRHQVTWPDPEPSILRAYDYIRENTPDDMIVLTDDLWAPYWTERRTLNIPIPLSDLRKGEPKYRTEIVRMLRDRNYRSDTDYRLAAVGPPETLRVSGPILWQAEDGIAVIGVTNLWARGE